MRRAEEATKELVRQAETIGEVLIQHMPAPRYLGGAKAAALDANKARLLAALKCFGVAAARISDIESAGRQWVVLEYTNQITKVVDPAANSPERAAWDEFWKPYRSELPDRLPMTSTQPCGPQARSRLGRGR